MNKYKSVTCIDTKIAVTVQPMWPMEENAKIVRICVWLSPPNPPTIADNAPMEVISLELCTFRYWAINAKGAIFCQDRRMRMFSQDIEAVTLGTQWWKGARPIFTLSVKIINHLIIKELGIKVEVRNLRSRRADLKACTIKYLIEDSVEEGEGFIISKGIKEIRLYSSPVQTPNQE